MKMTETFAATIAAVAPVIWLVAVVEVHQYIKRFESLQVLGTATTRARRYAEQIKGAMTLEQASNLSNIMKEGGASFREKFTQPPFKSVVSTVYALIVAILLASEGFSLFWLAGPQKTNSWMAWFCFIAVLLGFLAVLVLPGVTALGIAASVVRERDADLAWLANFARQQGSGSGGDQNSNDMG
ncbi:hypothetical protein [Streptomyces canus]|uniref:hypothetical protein n=1 Tax=Streptomyces canus TaxID=58343 RepID=UPI003714A6CE